MEFEIEKLYTQEEAARMLGLKNPKTLSVWRSTKRYDLPYIKVGRFVRYTGRGIKGFLDSRTVV
jgi:hypothetical protein